MSSAAALAANVLSPDGLSFNVFASNPIGPDRILASSAVLLVLAAILFAECGLLVGFFLPGDTLLFAAGISIAVGTVHTSLTAFLVVLPIAAFAGNLCGYAIGYVAGPKVFDRPNSRLFRPEYVLRSHRFFEKWGPLSVVLGRFVPIVRTVVSAMAGVARMNFAGYALYSAVGGIVWTDGVLLLGDRLGHIQWVRAHKGWVDYAVVVVVIIGLIPTLLHYLHGRRQDKARAVQPVEKVVD